MSPFSLVVGNFETSLMAISSVENHIIGSFYDLRSKIHTNIDKKEYLKAVGEAYHEGGKKYSNLAKESFKSTVIEASISKTIAGLNVFGSGKLCEYLWKDVVAEHFAKSITEVINGEYDDRSLSDKVLEVVDSIKGATEITIKILNDKKNDRSPWWSFAKAINNNRNDYRLQQFSLVAGMIDSGLGLGLGNFNDVDRYIINRVRNEKLKFKRLQESSQRIGNTGVFYACKYPSLRIHHNHGDGGSKEKVSIEVIDRAIYELKYFIKSEEALFTRSVSAYNNYFYECNKEQKYVIEEFLKLLRDRIGKSICICNEINKELYNKRRLLQEFLR